MTSSPAGHTERQGDDGVLAAINRLTLTNECDGVGVQPGSFGDVRHSVCPITKIKGTARDCPLF